MSDALDLLRAVLALACTDDEARATLDAALERECDPLVHCSLVHGIPIDIVMERAAAWAGIPYLPGIPADLPGHAAPERLEALADVRLFRVRVHDRDTAFGAPDFFGILRLGQALRRVPGLAQRLAIVPPQALRQYLADAASAALVDHARQGLSRRWPYAAAQLELTWPARYGFVLGMVLLICGTLAAPHAADLMLLTTLLVLVGPAAIRLAAIMAPRRSAPPLERPDDVDLPVYSVLVPLRSEARMVPQLARALTALDYPADRLEIMFVVEASSPATVAAVRERLQDARLSLVVVPDAEPRTKPKALDYALPLCRGDYVVVYDAEDIPAPDQLWQAAARFRADPDLVCLQAPLVITNGSDNALSALFAGEYAGLFGVILPALTQWGMPIPLGGTSNHFDLRALRSLGGWDAFNVTEDADLGVRLARRRMKVGMLDSPTRETAPTRLRAWLGQRTRWMKGWMQTFIVHNRDPAILAHQIGLPGTIVFELLILGMIAAPFLHCAMILDTLTRLVLGYPVLGGGLTSAGYLGVLLAGYGSAFAVTLLGIVRQGSFHLLGIQALLPIYWLLMSWATLRALRELAVQPFYWFKSPHEPAAGTSRMTMSQAPSRSLT